MATVSMDQAESSILARVIAPGNPTLSPSVAQELLLWRFTEADQQRMHDLAAKARQGSLLEEERTEAEAYERIDCLLSLVKSKARQSLKQVSRDQVHGE